MADEPEHILIGTPRDGQDDRALHEALLGEGFDDVKENKPADEGQ